jgi:hypothetical protein
MDPAALAGSANTNAPAATSAPLTEAPFAPRRFATADAAADATKYLRVVLFQTVLSVLFNIPPNLFIKLIYQDSSYDILSIQFKRRET